MFIIARQVSVWSDEELAKVKVGKLLIFSGRVAARV